MNFKKCPKCNRVLPETDFALRTRHCKICRRDYDWQYSYGISPEQYLELHNRQAGKCAICGKTLEEGYLCVDHNPETGKVRGLLCKECNTGLGNFKDNPENLTNAVKYLEVNNDERKSCKRL